MQARYPHIARFMKRKIVSTRTKLGIEAIPADPNSKPVRIKSLPHWASARVVFWSVRASEYEEAAGGLLVSGISYFLA